MKTLVIGSGEVGKSLFNVLKVAHEAYIRDIEELEVDGVEVLNICFPYFKGFEDVVKKYQNQYEPRLTIIHSTVPVGTSRNCGAVHSPIHGKHPNLSEGIRTFVKYVGGENAELAEEFLNKAGIKTKIVSSSEASELSKILCTTYYGWNVVFNKEVKKICDELKLPFEEVYGWTKFYNQGYEELGSSQFRRPLLDHYEGKIGGHCVVPNTRLLDSWLTKTLKERDETY